MGLVRTRRGDPQSAQRSQRRSAPGGDRCISMGGFGAYALARLEPGRFCVVGEHSATIYPTYGEADTSAFDNANNFARNDVLAAAKANPKLSGHAQLWWTTARKIISMTATSSSPAPCTSRCTPGPAPTTSRTGTRTGATTRASAPERSPAAGRRPTNSAADVVGQHPCYRDCRCLAAAGSFPAPRQSQVAYWQPAFANRGASSNPRKPRLSASGGGVASQHECGSQLAWTPTFVCAAIGRRQKC
jgi:hypothetical protein